MDQKDKQIELLTDRLSQLERKFEALADEQRKDVKFLTGLDDLEVKFRQIMERNIGDLFARLIRVELKLFPRLGRDLNHLHGIIGESDGRAYDPRDIRKPKT